MIQVVLQQAGYRTWLVDLQHLVVVCFEDDAVMGFACIFEDAATLLERWRSVETAFLTRYAEDIKTAGDKAWNVYSAFLCAGPADAVQAREIRWIEEDLERTRKLAATGVVSRDELITALLPVLPFQYQPRLDVEDLTQRLRKRIAAIAPAAADSALDETVPVTDVVRLLRPEK
ncbi:MAG TPA: hypothetical protein VM364_19210 [Vicinamibacterales bacterium]|nr:hypothetical protein [Vicinamibacterales bacterium]HWI19209.1 hypothetical protein [Vicinamibacterales bacterium]